MPEKPTRSKRSRLFCARIEPPLPPEVGGGHGIAGSVRGRVKAETLHRKAAGDAVRLCIAAGTLDAAIGDAPVRSHGQRDDNLTSDPQVPRGARIVPRGIDFPRDLLNLGRTTRALPITTRSAASATSLP